MLKSIKTACCFFCVFVIVNILTTTTDTLTFAAQPISPITEAGSVDYSLYGSLLKKYVKTGVVEYGGFKQEESVLDAHLAKMEQVPVNTLAHDEQLAFYINLYNAWTVKLILSKWPHITSIKDFSTLFRSPWERPIVRLQGKVLTLDEVEHGIIRPRFGDYRIHFAVNCSAKSCPPLLSVPFTGSNLQAQLDNVARSFINSQKGVQVLSSEPYVSKIFKWYANDFTPSVDAVIRKYASPELDGALNGATSPMPIHYQDYDWRLNSKTP